MPAVVLLGAQWGDEGKGKITDFLAEEAEVIVRYHGGNNAGHTVVIGDEVYKLHLIPSGIFYSAKTSVIAGGVVVDPKALFKELDGLMARGISDNLLISTNAHVIMPYHRLLDEVEEAARGANKIGTTGSGIGPVYRDKIGRSGIRIQDLLDPEEFAARLRVNLNEKNALLTKVYEREPLDFDAIYNEYLGYGTRLKKYVADTSLFINQRLEAGAKVLFEGAQGVMLDIDHGTYPYVTSSNCIAGGACTGAGVGPTAISAVAGVAKAYTTRVGEGPFPTELLDATGETLRQNGHEFGTTTGRPRRCGWFDAVEARYAIRLSGLNHLALTKLDVLSGIGTLKICTGYRLGAETLHDFPQGLKTLAQCVPVYEEVPGWDEDLTKVEKFADLPAAAQAYVRRIEELTGVPATIVAVGPGRNQTMVRGEIFGR